MSIKTAIGRVLRQQSKPADDKARMSKAVGGERKEDEAPPEFWKLFFEPGPDGLALIDCFRIFKIPNDTTDTNDDGESHVYFNLREKQEELLEYILSCWRQGKSAREMILKGRRYGMTRFLITLGLLMMLRTPGYDVTLIAQDDVMAEKHFTAVHELFDQIPRWALIDAGITVEKETGHEIRLRHGRFKTSSFCVAPAKRRALGRGAKNNMLILTEFPQWPDTARRDLSGLLATCKNRRGNAIFFESTARGYEEFYRRCKNAWEGKGTYHFFFVASYHHPDAHVPFKDEEEKAKLKDSVGKVVQFGGAEELGLVRILHKEGWGLQRILTHINWRRVTILDECEGLLTVQQREYPNTKEEAFTGTGRPVFNGNTINLLLPAAIAREDAAKKGLLRYSIERKVYFEESPYPADQLWTILELPREGEWYAFGSDTASGHEYHADGKTEADKSTMKIKHGPTGRTVARLNRHIEHGKHAWEILKGAFFYGLAQGFVERNMDGGTVISKCEDMELEGHNGIEFLLGGWRVVWSDQGKIKQWEVGFKTKLNTKPKLVARIQQHLESAALRTDPATCPFDRETLEQMQKYVRLTNDKGVRNATGAVPMGADEGFDDLVIDEGLALLSIDERLLDVKKLTAVPKGYFRRIDPVVEEVKRQAKMRNRQDESSGDDEILGSLF